MQKCNSSVLLKIEPNVLHDAFEKRKQNQRQTTTKKKLRLRFYGNEICSSFFRVQRFRYMYSSAQSMTTKFDRVYLHRLYV